MSRNQLILAFVGDALIMLVVSALMITAYDYWFAPTPIEVNDAEYCEVARITAEDTRVDVFGDKKVTDFWTVATEDGYVVLAPCE